MLKPFWRYYGGKWRSAPRYPAPRHDTIIEPFAGAAGYALRYPEREVLLIEKYAVIAEIWRWLIQASVDQVMAVPLVDATTDLPSWTPAGARHLVGFCLQDTAKRPCTNLSAGMRRKREAGEDRGWSEKMRARVASQVVQIRHWRVIEGDYTTAPDVCATWFIDPPYARTGVHYKHGSRGLDYTQLGAWCRRRRGQVMVCEEGLADWLPFQRLYDATTKSNHQSGTQELLWSLNTPDVMGADCLEHSCDQFH